MVKGFHLGERACLRLLIRAISVYKKPQDGNKDALSRLHANG